MKSFPFKITVLVLLPIAPLGLRAGEPEPAHDPLDITSEFVDRLVAEAQAQNPALQAAGARAEAANSAAAAVRSWEDPTASFGLWASTSRGFPSSQEGNLVYGLEQKLPLHGRPELMRKAAAAEASREGLAADFETQKLRRDLQVALNGLALADRQAAVAEQDLGWLDATLDAVDHRYRVGHASQVDWLKIQSARAMATDLVEGMTGNRVRAFRARLLALRSDPQ